VPSIKDICSKGRGVVQCGQTDSSDVNICTIGANNFGFFEIYDVSALRTGKGEGG